MKTLADCFTKEQKLTFEKNHGKLVRHRKFKVFIYKDGSRIIQNEDIVSAKNMAEARQQFLDIGVAAHNLYVLDVTK